MTLLPISVAKADIITFDVTVDNKVDFFNQVHIDGSSTTHNDSGSIPEQFFSDEIEFNLLSTENKDNLPLEHGGNGFQFWQNHFDLSPYSSSFLLGNDLIDSVNINDFDNIINQYALTPIGSYNPNLSVGSLSESIRFFRVLDGSSVRAIDNGTETSRFTYYQSFTISLPAPVSFDTKTYFDSYNTRDLIAHNSGANIDFSSWLETDVDWVSNDNSNSTSLYKFKMYTGTGSYQYSSANKVPEPSTIALMMMMGLLKLRKSN